MIENQEEIWDNIADEWDKYKKKVFEDLKVFLKGKRGNILDLGCGSGRNFLSMEKDAEIYGVDFSSEMLKFAEKRAKEIGLNVKLSKNSAESLAFEKSFFDFAIYVAVLHCIPESSKRKKSLNELFRVLKNKGQALIVVWSMENEKLRKKGDPNKQDQIISWKRKDGREYFRYYYIYKKEELEKDLTDAGFKILKSKEDDNILVWVEKP